jgi:geranylgeranyl pyrophosphate synthase
VLADVLAHPGNLVRAQLAYGIARGHGAEVGRALSLAIAVEYFHTASLIFDDMPMMDNATERRGHPCPHVAHGEAAATLGALALITRAYALLWEAIDAAPPEGRTRATALVSGCLGVTGVLDGQARDVHFARGPRDAREVLEVATAKTAPLIALALVLPARLGGAGEEQIARLERLAAAWGLAYQILDDFKDCVMSDREAGKSTARDASLGRPNLPLRAGPQEARRRLAVLLAEGRTLVDGLTGEDTTRWAPLARLQACLEDDRRSLDARLLARTSA